MCVLLRALAGLFLGAGILAMLALLPVRDGYVFPSLLGIEPYFPTWFLLLVAALIFLGLAAWCHCRANRRRFIR